ncbi:stage V sporulation protein AE [Effusibacillus lacus]|uniref:Stage V sporulation protein AE n=1 Tax=Effusibacillus lacus TaxID=1348429 RepID=A0A292YEQ1_9BACL|nr:stage V sporulation protein AE [Effusibacillus lacus]TCS76306.1 stage V sporulation protein AE [Effusibacillus lacus]GAX91852.1 stage V sporulation protein AE [Effusibacillus lacus]
MPCDQTPAKRKVILITDGDEIARKTVEAAARKVGARVISRSAGNPTPLSGREIVELVHQALHDPVLVMFDDNGHDEEGHGEKALREFVSHPSIEVIGAIAVASNTRLVDGTQVDFSLDSKGNIVRDGVDKYGEPLGLRNPVISGDTVDVLRECEVPVVVGIGDIGKMMGRDAYYKGAPITTSAILEILKRNGYNSG